MNSSRPADLPAKKKKKKVSRPTSVHSGWDNLGAKSTFSTAAMPINEEDDSLVKYGHQQSEVLLSRGSTTPKRVSTWLLKPLVIMREPLLLEYPVSVWHAGWSPQFLEPQHSFVRAIVAQPSSITIPAWDIWVLDSVLVSSPSYCVDI